jgi:hypothetical protein
VKDITVICDNNHKYKSKPEALQQVCPLLNHILHTFLENSNFYPVKNIHHDIGVVGCCVSTNKEPNPAPIA